MYLIYVITTQKIILIFKGFQANKMKKMLQEFKKFALKGNIVDMAVGVVVGGAFGKIVTSLVNDIITPIVSLITGQTTKLADQFIALDGHRYATIDEAKAAGISTLNYGAFITAIIDFVIIAFSIFIIIKQLNNVQEKIAKLTNKEAEHPALPTTKECIYCKSIIHIDAVKCSNCTSDLPSDII